MNRKGVEGALSLLRYLPRVSLTNVYPNREEIRKKNRRRGDHGGGTHGHGNKGAKQRCSYPYLGFECGHGPAFIFRIPMVYYPKGFHNRQYPTISLNDLQLLIDTNRLDASQPIDLVSLFNTGLYRIDIKEKHFGVHLTDKGADNFTAKVNIEVQHAKEAVIAAVERNGGVITNAYYDVQCLSAMSDTQRFFESGCVIPSRTLPPKDLLEFYMDPKSRGYLADPEKIAEDRLTLSQKYGYKLPDYSADSVPEMFKMRKDPRQVFFGLEPGWLVNVKDKTILKPKDEMLQKYYQQ